MCTLGTLRSDFQVISSSRCRTTRTGLPGRPPAEETAPVSTVTASLVFGTSPLVKPLTTRTRPWLSRSDRAMRGAAARVLGRAEGTLARAAGALLPVGLLATAANLAAGLRGVRALPGGGLLRHHDLVDQRHVHLGGEDLLRQVYRLAALAGRRDDADFGHQASLPTCCGVLTALRTNTTRPLGPGTAPLISSRPRSASTDCTVSD